MMGSAAGTHGKRRGFEQRSRRSSIWLCGLAALAACGSAGESTGSSGGGSGGGGSGGGGSGGGGGGSGGGSTSIGGGIGPGTVSQDPAIPSTAFYVATDGNNASAGTQAQPWRTLTYAIGRLVAGDTLVVRGGSYLESSVRIAIAGTAGAPITIRNHPGEVPIVDADYAQFRTVGNTDWEVVDSGKSIWRSTASFAGGGQLYGYFGADNGSYRLVPYETYADLAATGENYSESAPYYCGPGVFWNTADQRIYVRTQRSTYQARFSLQVPQNLDPRATPMTIGPSRTVLNVTSAARYVVLSGLTLQGGERIGDLPNGCHHLTFRNCAMRIGRYGFVVRDGFHDMLLDGVTMRGYFPPWIARSDIKANTNPAHLMQDAAFEINGATDAIEIANSRFLGMFDAIDTYGTPTNMRVHHCEFATIRDDVFEIATAGYEIRFDHNYCHQVTQGVSWNGSTAPTLAMAGRKYVHHNVIDTSQEQLYGRADPFALSEAKWLGPTGNGMASGPIFSLHETGGLNGPDPWKVYRNTFVSGADVDNEGLGVCYMFPGSNPAYPHEVFDNIFVQKGNQWILRRGRVADGSQCFDGNLYFRSHANPTTSLLEGFTSGSTTRSFTSLYGFVTSSLWLQSRTFYSPGWELAGVEGDPQLDSNYRPAATGPAASGALDLASKGWPDAGSAGHRGAITP
jgi:hypothetical protein